MIQVIYTNEETGSQRLNTFLKNRPIKLGTLFIIVFIAYKNNFNLKTTEVICPDLSKHRNTRKHWLETLVKCLSSLKPAGPKGTLHTTTLPFLQVTVFYIKDLFIIIAFLESSVSAS